MKRKRSITVGVVLTVAAMMLTSLQIVFAQPEFADEAFARIWNQQDRAVYEGFSDRSWTWGPENITNGLMEDFEEGERGERMVQYFDKSRMEINDPDADPASRFYVTNGLLPIEMMTGRIQVGLDPNNIITRAQAQISAIGDPGNYPTYADLAPLYRVEGSSPEGAFGDPITSLLNTDGTIDPDGLTTYENDPSTVLVESPTGPTGYGVPRAFANYMTQQGLVFVNNQYVTQQVYDPLFVFGLPVTEAFWVNATVAGEEVPVLFQVFERRVITYNPANDPSFRVEMGNVGQHYYQWRYPENGTQGEPTEEPYPAP